MICSAITAGLPVTIQCSPPLFGLAGALAYRTACRAALETLRTQVETGPRAAAGHRPPGRRGRPPGQRTAHREEGGRPLCRRFGLAAAETPAAAKALEARLDDETDEEVRDQILLALDNVWESQGKKITRKQIDQRIEPTAGKLDKPVAVWIDEKRLPPLCFAKGGERLKPQAVRYLLYRQSRAREMQPDVECKPLYALIDRKTSGDFALSVLQMYFGSKMAAEDRWALAVAALLGDDRVVAVLLQQIRTWVDG